MEGISGIITRLEKQREAIDKAIAALREVDSAGPARRGRPRGSTNAAPRRKRVLSDEARRKMAEAQKRRWAAARKAAASKKTA